MVLGLSVDRGTKNVGGEGGREGEMVMPFLRAVTSL